MRKSLVRKSLMRKSLMRKHLMLSFVFIAVISAAPATALDLPARVVTGFVDLEVNGLLALDGEKEGALVLVPVGGQLNAAPPAPVIAAIEPEVIPLSSSEVDYPLLRDAYANSALDSESEVLAWREEARPASRDLAEP